MATISKRGPHQYQAQVRRKGFPTQTHTLETKRDAEDWARQIEADMRRGTFVDRSEAEQTTFAELLERYRQEVTPEKRGWCAENSRLRQWQRHPLASRPLATLRSVDFASYRDERLKSVGPKTVQLELSLISAVFNVAKRDWSIPVENPITHIRKPKAPKGRERRLEGDEEARLLAAAKAGRTDSLDVCITLAIETGMRRGEIAELTWAQIDLRNHVIRLSMTKNGDDRIVPLSEVAEAALQSLPRPLHGGRVTKFHDSNGLGAAFRRACERAGIVGLCFHDLRHEAASRLAPTMPQTTLAKVFGWRTLQMAMRYYNPTADELVAAVRAAA
ncbi:integrase [Jeongeupia sp. HS-3]|uniref:site-specific integrase n=1 Tax=Jeongeupia sp. HS-3 TaxID=1009682 RepID=UPI0018A43483|nr:site-specific integrase [Jeongeupia sp. HS-3]BCL76677.1 integrase [Jeongeupia sp. HS-3]